MINIILFTILTRLLSSTTITREDIGGPGIAAFCHPNKLCCTDVITSYTECKTDSPGYFKFKQPLTGWYTIDKTPPIGAGGGGVIVDTKEPYVLVAKVVRQKKKRKLTVNLLSAVELSFGYAAKLCEKEGTTIATIHDKSHRNYDEQYYLMAKTCYKESYRKKLFSDVDPAITFNENNLKSGCIIGLFKTTCKDKSYFSGDDLYDEKKLNYYWIGNGGYCKGKNCRHPNKIKNPGKYFSSSEQFSASSPNCAAFKRFDSKDAKYEFLKNNFYTDNTGKFDVDVMANFVTKINENNPDGTSKVGGLFESVDCLLHMNNLLKFVVCNNREYWHTSIRMKCYEYPNNGLPQPRPPYVPLPAPNPAPPSECQCIQNPSKWSVKYQTFHDNCDDEARFTYYPKCDSYTGNGNYFYGLDTKFVKFVSTNGGDGVAGEFNLKADSGKWKHAACIDTDATYKLEYFTRTFVPDVKSNGGGTGSGSGKVKGKYVYTSDGKVQTCGNTYSWGTVNNNKPIKTPKILFHVHLINKKGIIKGMDGQYTHVDIGNVYWRTIITSIDALSLTPGQTKLKLVVNYVVNKYSTDYHLVHNDVYNHLEAVREHMFMSSVSDLLKNEFCYDSSNEDETKAFNKFGDFQSKFVPSTGDKMGKWRTFWSENRARTLNYNFKTPINSKSYRNKIHLLPLCYTYNHAMFHRGSQVKAAYTYNFHTKRHTQTDKHKKKHEEEQMYRHSSSYKGEYIVPDPKNYIAMNNYRFFPNFGVDAALKFSIGSKTRKVTQEINFGNVKKFKRHQFYAVQMTYTFDLQGMDSSKPLLYDGNVHYSDYVKSEGRRGARNKRNKNRKNKRGGVKSANSVSACQGKDKSTGKGKGEELDRWCQHGLAWIVNDNGGTKLVSDKKSGTNSDTSDEIKILGMEMNESALIATSVILSLVIIVTVALCACYTARRIKAKKEVKGFENFD